MNQTMLGGPRKALRLINDGQQTSLENLCVKSIDIILIDRTASMPQYLTSNFHSYKFLL